MNHTDYGSAGLLWLSYLLFASSLVAEPLSLPAGSLTTGCAPPSPVWVIPSSGLLVYRKDWSEGRPAFVDGAGTGLNVRCDHVRPFTEGLAGVLVNGRLGFIDTTGAIVIEPAFRNVGPFSEGLAWVESLSGGHGYIDKTGRLVIPPVFRVAGDFHCGRAVACTTGPFGYIDDSGAWAIPPRFETAKPFSEGLAAVSLTLKDPRYGFVDVTGELVIPPRFELADEFSEGLAAVTLDGERWGYIDRQGRIVVEPLYGDAYAFSCGLAQVRRYDSRCRGFIDRTGAIPFPLRFVETFPFSEGFACVAEDDTWPRKFGYIDTSGRWRVPPRFLTGWPFTGGLAVVHDPVPGFDGAEAYRMGVIDASGSFIWRGDEIFGTRKDVKPAR